MRAAALVLGVGLMVAACGSDAAAPWNDGAGQAAAGGTIGGPGGDCPLPVTMSVAEKWKPRSVPAGIYDIDGARLACEIDAKPADHVGFLRVYVTPNAAAPRSVLAKFLADAKSATEDQYRDVAPGVELTYVSTTDGDSVRRRVYAVPAPGHTVAVVLDAFDSDEYDDMVPAFLLAEHTIKAS
jgi:hypothetical protein